MKYVFATLTLLLLVGCQNSAQKPQSKQYSLAIQALDREAKLRGFRWTIWRYPSGYEAMAYYKCTMETDSDWSKSSRCDYWWVFMDETENSAAVGLTNLLDKNEGPNARWTVDEITSVASGGTKP